MAVANGDKQITDHTADLVTEIGAGVTDAASSGNVVIPCGVLSETAQILDQVAEQFHGGIWSTCPCGEDHDQNQLDSLMPTALKADAEMARQLLLSAVVSVG
jgi:hypothetical protein